MPRQPTPAKTFNLDAVARSLTVQHEWVAFLLAHAETALSLNPDMKHGPALRHAAAGCRAALYPEQGR
ncbi:MAG: hypothetical protein PHT60_15795 [Acidiphilium sp.]|nr:hypothetical protein [Acidiphilium sp.]